MGLWVMGCRSSGYGVVGDGGGGSYGVVGDGWWW